MIKNLEASLNQVEATYSEVVDIANEMLKELFSPINELVDNLNNDVQDMQIDEIRDYIMKLSIQSFRISEPKDRSTLKAKCAEALRKHNYAIEFNGAEGTINTKDNTALINTANYIVTEALYDLVSDLLKTKLDEIHRLVDALKSILMSKMQEVKLSMNGVTE